MRRLWQLVLCGGLWACDGDEIVVVGALEPPVDLFYELEPSGDAEAPAGVLLAWSASPSAEVEFYRIYSRPMDGSFGLRGETTSNTFHDNGVPHYEYYVTAVGAGAESDRSNVVQVDERLRLEAPAALVSISLDAAIHLAWSDNAFTTSPDGFRDYRVYSTSYSLDDGLCGASWGLEGTTIAPEFLVSAMPNGVPRCFGVSAVSVEGFESFWSPLRNDTPRADARNVQLFAFDVDPARSGFRFWRDDNSDGRASAAELGFVQDGSRPDLDFWLFRDASERMFFVLADLDLGTTGRTYSGAAIADLTAIDVAPESGYSASDLLIQPGFGYVFQMDGGDGFFRYGAIRATHVGREYVIFDWSFQDDPGNPELHVVPTGIH